MTLSHSFLFLPDSNEYVNQMSSIRENFSINF